MQKLHGAVNTNEYEYINYYRTQYGNIPLWVTTSILTFGSLSKMYKVLPSAIPCHFAGQQIGNQHEDYDIMLLYKSLIISLPTI